MLDFLLTLLSQRFVADDLGTSFSKSDRVWDDLGRNCSWTGEWIREWDWRGMAELPTTRVVGRSIVLNQKNDVDPLVMRAIWLGKSLVALRCRLQTNEPCELD